jgi:hypothetical protein
VRRCCPAHRSKSVWRASSGPTGCSSRTTNACGCVTIRHRQHHDRRSCIICHHTHGFPVAGFPERRAADAGHARAEGADRAQGEDGARGVRTGRLRGSPHTCGFFLPSSVQKGRMRSAEQASHELVLQQKQRMEVNAAQRTHCGAPRVTGAMRGRSASGGRRRSRRR